MTREFAGRGAIVLGGAGGIGSAVVRELADRGAEVLAVDLAGTRPSTVDERARYLAADAQSESAAKNAFGLLTAPATLLVNSTLSEAPTPLAEESAEGFLRPFQVMTGSAWLWGKELVASADGRPAAMVHIASVHAYGALPDFGPYAAAKAALLALTRAMAIEWGPRDVRCNAVAPSFVPVPRNSEQWADEESMAERVTRFPLRRVPKPADIANAVRFLLSDDASTITGTCLPVDGGLLARLP
jgi:NAD(P)-dependent dehydrogenase (short-subunit alcohol dehydrogenase family)